MFMHRCYGQICLPRSTVLNLQQSVYFSNPRLSLDGKSGGAKHVSLLNCRSQRKRSAAKRVMLTRAHRVSYGPSMERQTPSAFSSVLSEATCSCHPL